MNVRACMYVFTLLVGEKLCHVNNYTPGRGKIVPRNYTPGIEKIVLRNVTLLV